MSKYEEALKRPTGKNGKGWKYADDDSMQAFLAQELGKMHNLQGRAIYDWADKHQISLLERQKRKDFSEPAEMILLACVLNDIHIDDLLKEMKS